MFHLEWQCEGVARASGIENDETSTTDRGWFRHSREALLGDAVDWPFDWRFRRVVRRAQRFVAGRSRRASGADAHGTAAAVFETARAPSAQARAREALRGGDVPGRR